MRHISTRKALHPTITRYAVNVDAGSQRHVACVLLEDCHAFVGVGQGDLG